MDVVLMRAICGARTVWRCRANISIIDQVSINLSSEKNPHESGSPAPSNGPHGPATARDLPRRPAGRHDGEWAARSARMGQRLHDAGLEPGDRVTLFMRNHPRATSN
jgi:hypothetical protein